MAAAYCLAKCIALLCSIVSLHCAHQVHCGLATGDTQYAEIVVILTKAPHCAVIEAELHLLFTNCPLIESISLLLSLSLLPLSLSHYFLFSFCSLVLVHSGHRSSFCCLVGCGFKREGTVK